MYASKVENIFAELKLEVSDFSPEKNQVLWKMCDFYQTFEVKKKIKK